MTSGQHGETSPLLGRASTAVSNTQESPISEPKINRAQLVALLTLTLFLVEGAASMSVPAQNVIFEDIICKHYVVSLNRTDSPFLPPPVDSNPCKSEAVLAELGLLLGWKGTAEVVPGFVLGIPYGMLADRWGRKPVVLLGLLGIFLVELGIRVVAYWPQVFPLRAIWFMATFFLIGGGGPVASSIVFTIATDISTDAERADLFVILLAAVLSAEILGTPLGSALVEFTGAWVPYLISPAIIGLTSCLFIMIPETLHSSNTITNQDPSLAITKVLNLWSYLSTLVLRNIWNQAKHATSHALPALWQNLALVCLVMAFMINVLTRQTIDYVVLYATKKFGWTFPQASLLLSLRSGTNLCLILLVIPTVSYYLLQYRDYSTARKDLMLLRIQSVLLVTGALLIGLAESPVPLVTGVAVFALGGAWSVNLRSMATMLVQPSHFATLNSALSMSQALGTMLCGPLIAALWAKGLKLGGAALGLPFLGAAGVLALAMAVTWLVRIPDAAESDQDTEVVVAAESHDDDINVA